MNEKKESYEERLKRRTKTPDKYEKYLAFVLEKKK